MIKIYNVIRILNNRKYSIALTNTNFFSTLSTHSKSDDWGYGGAVLRNTAGQSVVTDAL